MRDDAGGPRTCALIAMAVLTFVPPLAEAQSPLYRLAATFRFFGSERASSVPPVAGGSGGVSIYSRTVVVPPGVNVMYVTMSTTGDGHLGARHQFACRTALPGGAFAPCQAGPADPAGGAPAGWITLQRHRDYNRDYQPRADVRPFPGDAAGGAGDLHDNGITYQWCVPVPFSSVASSRIVQLRMASRADPITTLPPPPVFIEGLHVFVDASLIPTRSLACAADTTTLPATVTNAQTPAAQQPEP
jgi:hypothetical protein